MILLNRFVKPTRGSGPFRLVRTHYLFDFWAMGDWKQMNLGAWCVMGRNKRPSSNTPSAPLTLYPISFLPQKYKKRLGPSLQVLVQLICYVLFSINMEWYEMVRMGIK